MIMLCCFFMDLLDFYGSLVGIEKSEVIVKGDG